ncbi:MAG: porin [Gammaproteobacteria bacterium]|nr:porin [Gammaproteobacteria bacterium]
MNKKLIAAAIAAALAVPMAAQAEVTVYGKGHVSLDSIDNGTDSSLHVQSNSSRIGVKADYDLGDGLKAITQMEFGFNISDKTAISADRNSFVGLSGGFGTVLAGRHDTPFKNVGRMADLFGDEVGDIRNIGDSSTGGGGGWDLRPNNVIAYASPTFAGSWSVLAAYVAEDGVKDTDAQSINAVGMAGPVKLGIAYEKHNLGTGLGDESGLRAAAQFSIGMVELVAGWSSYTDQGNISGRDSTVTSLGAKFKLSGNNAIKAQWASRSNDQLTDRDATIMAVGFEHKLNKKTGVYLDYAKTNNDAAATYAVDAGGHGKEVNTVAAGKDPSVVSLGMYINF